MRGASHSVSLGLPPGLSLRQTPSDQSVDGLCLGQAVLHQVIATTETRGLATISLLGLLDLPFNPS